MLESVDILTALSMLGNAILFVLTYRVNKQKRHVEVAKQRHELELQRLKDARGNMMEDQEALSTLSNKLSEVFVKLAEAQNIQTNLLNKLRTCEHEKAHIENILKNIQDGNE